MCSPTPEQRAEALVAVGPKEPSGLWFVRLTEVVSPDVFLGPYENPALAKGYADRVCGFVAAVIRTARTEGADRGRRGEP